LEPLRLYRGHSAVVEVRSVNSGRYSILSFIQQDVDWHASNENMFASVGDDKKLMM
jgi:hypothetical protein